MLAQKYPDRTLQLYDRLAEPPSPDDDTVWNDVAKFYLIGLGARGQYALQTFGVWDEVEQRCVAVVGRKDWPPDSEEGVERIFTKEDKKVATQVLPRDKLVGVLHQHIRENYDGKIFLNYGYEVHPVDFEFRGGSQVLLQIVQCSETAVRLNPSAVRTAIDKQDEMLCDTQGGKFVASDLVIAADGTVRTIANAMERQDQQRFRAMNPLQRLRAGRPFRVKRYLDDNQRIYKTIPMKIPKDWRPDLNYSARTKEGRINYDALPANENGEYCGVLLLKKGDPMAQADTSPTELRQLMDDVLPQFSALLDDEVVAAVAQKPVSYLPGFRYAGPRLNQGDRCVLLGDCAHTVKPYFGLGANSALEDVKIMSEILDATEHDIPAAVREFSRRRAPESESLVRISRDLDRPGKIGFVTFILPLILDSIFSKAMPKLFQPNIITMLQKENWTFRQVASRKRLDRLGQLSIIAAGLTGTGFVARVLVRSVARMMGKSTTKVAMGLIGAAFGIGLLRRLAGLVAPGSAPADVVTKMATNKKSKEQSDSPLSSRQS
jgi:2-polyprenyl-6-methoxyphenol hydroxylase-like FAD-dependent oxidoreductase